MNDVSESREAATPPGGVLSSLPRTRPQRASRRRERERASGSAAKTPPKPSPKSGRAKRARLPEPPVPPQGFEPEGDGASTTAITPPTGTEVLTSLLDLAGDVVGAGLSSGGRLLRDALSRL